MLSSAGLASFIAAALVVLLIPGPAVMFVVTQSARQGIRAGLSSVVGLCAGAMFHVAAAAFGLSAVLLASATAFELVKMAGAVYLMWLGIRAFRTAGTPIIAMRSEPKPTRRLFADGIVVSLLNPKIAIFFLAFLPQFVDPRRGSIPLQLALLGLLYVGMALITDSCYAVLASTAGKWLSGHVGRSRLPGYVSGTVYIGLGLGAALTSRRS